MLRRAVLKGVAQMCQGVRGISTTSALAVQAAVKQDVLGDILSEQLDAIRAAGTFKQETIITTPQAASIGVLPGGKELLNFCANNYLGLSNHPHLVDAAMKTLMTHGFGMSSVRFICGTQDIHKQLEHKVSAFHGTEDAILFPSCFDANGGLFEALLSAQDAVISDELNHASIIDGIRLCKAQRLRFKHMDMEDLERKLQEAKDARVKLIATDGVFSMDGDIAPLKDITVLAEKYGAYVFVDECHATGFVGRNGRGTDEYWDVRGKIDIITSTLGKALGGATGGYATGKAQVIATLRQRARPYLFSNTVAPAVVGASLAMFDMLSSTTHLRDKVQANTDYFRKEMTKAGFQIRPGSHPIVPIMLGEASLAGKMAQMMLDKGIYVVAFSYPVVPKGKARIRVQVSAAHEQEHLDKAIAAFTAVGKELGVLQ